MKRKLLITLLLLSNLTFSQNTVGTILNTQDAYDGYTLFSVDKLTYLINNCGEVINSWTSNHPPGSAFYLLEDGSLLRASRIENLNFPSFPKGGLIEKYNWDGDLTWSFKYSDATVVQHHDIYPMPNGNILVLALKQMTYAQAIAAGRNPSLLVEDGLYDQQIVELQPVGPDNANIVWQWNASDHLIQDFDSNKENYGEISSNPQRLNINFINEKFKGKNWLHINSIQFDPTLDQIVISSLNLSEFWIIDHSTTTLEASSSTGGMYGKGGDFLYRWGNPQAYDQGTAIDRQLYGQHSPHFIQKGLMDEGKIMVFNNGDERTPEFSEVLIINAPTSSPGNYSLTSNSAYGPLAPDYAYSDLSNGTSKFYSRIVSGAQRLPNNNILICQGSAGRLFEIDENEHIVWEYINPVNSNTGAIVDQGSSALSNLVFRAYKYGKDYPAFVGKDLTPKAPIEGNPDLSNCTLLNLKDDQFTDLKIHPNPVHSYLNINSTKPIDKIEIFDILGVQVGRSTQGGSLDLSTYKSGVYILKIYSSNASINRKIIKQ
ncbi:aryl-sulfate sulfotransferase [Gelidibacter sp.]|uniref:aryl-sulfate sulfotransferase n=1 Tax=Gelidibacter sp. TaxID=2018083 RepID=UPI002C5E58C5|nr:aryl-sulfate sulfotransferase [Gelidibacter sp.]HUH28479.1 aryl-sulfate sulfotransferase [Gelidibacter sp.]